MSNLVCYVSELDEPHSSYSHFDSSYPASNVIDRDPSTNSNFARWYATTGGLKSSTLYWKFNVSAIPETATIDSVSCKARVYRQSSNVGQLMSSTLSMAIGTTDKSDANEVSFVTEDTLISVPCGTWTRTELNNIRLVMKVTRSIIGSSQAHYIDFRGASLTIEYTVPSQEKFMLKIDGIWKNATSVYKKVNGTWVLQNDLSSVIDPDVSYVKS